MDTKAKRTTDRGNIYPWDIDKIDDLSGPRNVPTVLQLSSYSVRTGTKVKEIKEVLVEALEPCNFNLMCEVRDDKEMLSLVFCRGKWITNWMGDAGQRFHKWLRPLKANLAKEQRG